VSARREEDVKPAGENADGDRGAGAPADGAGSKALVTRRQGPIITVESQRASQPAVRTPTGFASPKQLGAFRELRTQLMTAAAGAGMAASFTTLVVPLSAGAGGSFVARNLAAAFTLEERRLAILIDCNLAHPTQHTALGVEMDDGGLYDYLERPHGDLQRLIQPTCIPALHLIPAGHPPAIPREYLSSSAMRSAMTALRQPDCYVFLDAPPAKTAPDARILSELADFVLLVVGYGQDTTDAIAKAAALFPPTKFAGVVFIEPTA
jgi:Mrp family chromosome partitioning ATPase